MPPKSTTTAAAAEKAPVTEVAAETPAADVEVEDAAEEESEDEDMPELEDAEKDAAGNVVNRSEKKARKGQ